MEQVVLRKVRDLGSFFYAVNWRHGPMLEKKGRSEEMVATTPALGTKGTFPSAGGWLI